MVMIRIFSITISPWWVFLTSFADLTKISITARAWSTAFFECLSAILRWRSLTCSRTLCLASSIFDGVYVESRMLALAITTLAGREITVPERSCMTDCWVCVTVFVYHWGGRYHHDCRILFQFFFQSLIIKKNGGFFIMIFIIVGEGRGGGVRRL